MCVIVDANVASDVFDSPPQPDFVPLWRWIEEQDGVIVYGGKLAKELGRIDHVARRLQQLSLAGKAKVPDSVRLAKEEKAVGHSGLCKSNDSHVIALARVTKARTLCSRDKKLHEDFKNPKLVANPRGQIYQDKTHAKLLGHTAGCIGGKVLGQ
jgi:hypothetical protein